MAIDLRPPADCLVRQSVCWCCFSWIVHSEEFLPVIRSATFSAARQPVARCGPSTAQPQFLVVLADGFDQRRCGFSFQDVANTLCATAFCATGFCVPPGRLGDVGQSVLSQQLGDRDRLHTDVSNSSRFSESISGWQYRSPTSATATSASSAPAAAPAATISATTSVISPGWRCHAGWPGGSRRHCRRRRIRPLPALCAWKARAAFPVSARPR